jgi:hypothetical protein
MRTLFIGAMLGLVAIGLLACDQPKKKAYVEGQFQMSTSPTVFDFGGTLAHGGADYYGSCKYSKSDELFEFEVGDAKMVNIDSAAQLYVKFTGIEGPATEGVYSDPVAKIAKNDETLRTLFGSAVIKSGGNQFSFGQPDPTVNENCYVELFAKAVTGEVTPTEDKAFNYYVGLHCTNLDNVVDSGGQPLNSFNGFFFFKGC